MIEVTGLWRETMQDETDWARILRALYEGRLFIDDSTVEGTSFELVDYLSRQESLEHLEEREITETLEDMERAGLVDLLPMEGNLTKDEGEEMYGGLTRDGFDVAHERDLRERQQSLIESQNALMESQNVSSQKIAAFTVILGAAALVQAAAAVFTAPWPVNLGLGVLYLGVLVGLLLSQDRWLMSEAEEQKTAT